MTAFGAFYNYITYFPIIQHTNLYHSIKPCSWQDNRQNLRKFTTGKREFLFFLKNLENRY